MSLEYTAPAEALELAGRRLRDPRLQERVAAYLGGVWPQGFTELADKPAAVYAPYLATGNGTEVDFLKQASRDGFRPVVATYRGLPWSKLNPGLRDCYQPPLRLADGQEVRNWVVPTKQRSGAVGTANTHYPGIDILQYWQGIRRAVLGASGLASQEAVVDFGAWYDTQAQRFGWQAGAKSPFYYKALMAFYASGRAVLFDTPPTEYAGRVMKPAFDQAAEDLGAQPMLTNVLTPAVPDWVDLSFLDEQAAQRLLTTGKIEEV